MKKKLNYLLIAFIAVITLFGCTKKEDVNKTTKPTSNEQETSIKQDSTTEQETFIEQETTTEHKHDYKEEVIKAECGKEGSKIFTCTICNDSYSEIIPALEHSYTLTNIVNPTCTSNGTKTYTCENCLNSYLEEIESTGHVYNKAITKNATCISEGLYTYTCTNCNNSYTEVIPKTDHSWINATCTSAQKCSVCGITNGSELGHSEDSDGVCKVCGEQVSYPFEYILAAHALEYAYEKAKFPSSVTIETAYYIEANGAGYPMAILICSADNELGGKGRLYSEALLINGEIDYYITSNNPMVSYNDFTKLNIQKCYNAYEKTFY